jgi:hypothetical protein
MRKGKAESTWMEVMVNLGLGMVVWGVSQEKLVTMADN